MKLIFLNSFHFRSNLHGSVFAANDSLSQEEKSSTISGHERKGSSPIFTVATIYHERAQQAETNPAQLETVEKVQRDRIRPVNPSGLTSSSPHPSCTSALKKYYN